MKMVARIILASPHFEMNDRITPVVILFFYALGLLGLYRLIASGTMASWQMVLRRLHRCRKLVLQRFFSRTGSIVDGL